MRISSRIPSLVLALAGTLAACSDDNNNTTTPDARANTPDAAVPSPDANITASLADKVDTIVFIYAENRGFDNVYGLFEGANGIPGVNPTSSQTTPLPQVDRDGTQLTKLPKTWGGVTAPGQTPAISEAMTDNLANAPFKLEMAFGVTLPQDVITRDLYHRFFENQMQLNGGRNDTFAAFADSGGLVMGYYDGSEMAMWDIAKEFVLADNLFQGAFGGSFLTHQYLICACAPEYPNADTDPALPTIAAIDVDQSQNFLPRLTLNVTTQPSALDGPPIFVRSGNIAPKNYFGDGTFRAVNTMQPPYQPSANAYAASDTTHLFADRSKPNTLPPQTATTIGDRLDAKGVTWAWYAGAFNDTLAAATGDRTGFPQPFTPGIVPNYQFHHQPFNYYTKLDPVAGAAYRTEHLKDYQDLVDAAVHGTLPHVVFYKPEGDVNQHAGYASLQKGDVHLAAVVDMLRGSPQYAKMVIVVTYDENGGFWDHVAPPKGDLIGPGSRIPAIIISPLAKPHFVDHTQYDTYSIIRLISRRFGLDPLPGMTARDTALQTNGAPPMGDLTHALNL
jgi:acid phosphatase